MLPCNHPITQSPNHPITQSPNHPITQLPNPPIPQSPNSPYCSNDDRAVLGSKPQAVAESRVDLGCASLVRDEIEIACRIGSAEVDGGRQEAAIDSERRRHDAGRA